MGSDDLWLADRDHMAEVVSQRDLQAPNASLCTALWACRSGILRPYSLIRSMIMTWMDLSKHTGHATLIHVVDNVLDATGSSSSLQQ